MMHVWTCYKGATMLRPKDFVYEFAATWTIQGGDGKTIHKISCSYKTANEAAENGPKDAEIIRIKKVG